MNLKQIRNFSIIAHIDHGKSTLADRLLELTDTVEKRNMKKQFLDSMDLEQEKGITIKLKAVRMIYKYNNESYILNLIDTPGHVDFGYEVSRSLAACEGALLVVDASQGIQAQTINNVEKAINLGLKIIPIVNKIDLPNASPEQTALDIVNTFNFNQEDILFVSAKSGQNTNLVLNKIISDIPCPIGDINKPFRGLVFDSYFDEHLGVVANIKVVDGKINVNEKIHFLRSNAVTSAIKVGFFNPKMVESKTLIAGEVGFIATGLKEIRNVKVGDTIAKNKDAVDPLKGYKEPQPIVFLGLYPEDSSKYLDLRRALERLSLTDAALYFEAESTGEAGQGLGQGFKCGFLGILHAEIIRERIEREFKIPLIATLPSVSYKVTLSTNQVIKISSAVKFPDSSKVLKIEEPIVKVFIYSPSIYIGQIMDLVSKKRGEIVGSVYSKNKGGKEQKVKIEILMPLSEMITDFYDSLKSLSSGYASLDYELHGYKVSNVVKLTIIVAEEEVLALARMSHMSKAEEVGRKLVLSLKDVLPRAQFPIKLQAAIGGKIVARETISAVRKDVTGYLYGGDVTRKRKLLEKQKKGKKKLTRLGRINIPKQAFWKVVKI